MKTTNQKIEPLRTIQAEDRKLKLFPNKIQSFADENHPTNMATTTNTRPKNISLHLFIVIFYIIGHLKTFLFLNVYYEILKNILHL